MKVLFKKLVPHAIIPKRSNLTDAGMDLSSAEDVIVPPDGGRRLVSTGLQIAIVPNFSNSFIEIESDAFQCFKPSDSIKDVVGNVEALEDCIVNNNILTYVWQAEVRPRSGLAWKNGVTVLNSPGTIDNGYRGELKVIVINHSDEPFEIKKGDRIAQLVFTRSYLLDVQEVDKFPDETSRGEGGFGSSGS